MLICQCIALPVEERDESKTYWVDPSCEAIGQGGFIRGITETIWTAGRIAESLYAFDGQLSDPGKAVIRIMNLESILTDHSEYIFSIASIMGFHNDPRALFKHSK